MNIKHVSVWDTHIYLINCQLPCTSYAYWRVLGWLVFHICLVLPKVIDCKRYYKNLQACRDPFMLRILNEYAAQKPAQTIWLVWCLLTASTLWGFTYHTRFGDVSVENADHLLSILWVVLRFWRDEGTLWNCFSKIIQRHVLLKRKGCNLSTSTCPH